MASNLRKIGLAWQLKPTHGWGVYGLEIARHASLAGRFSPVILEELDPEVFDVLEMQSILPRLVQPLVTSPGALQKFIAAGTRLPFAVLHALGEGLEAQFTKTAEGVRGARDHALTFFENARVSRRDVEAYNRFASVTAGSTWNGDILRAAGVENVGVTFQGVDPALFHPAPARNLFRDRFVIFAGGKMEFRKGQDIALKALKIFIDRHPDTLLLCVWGTQWPDSRSYRQFRFSPWLETPPPPNERGHLDLAAWFGQFGIGRRNVLAYAGSAHKDMPALVREADIALFPNRCEGGTNLVAMETMACGIPAIISANTGHLDIIHEGACLPLRDQAPVTGTPGIDTAGWGESSVEEILDRLEFAYTQKDAARAIGRQGAERMHRLSWDRQIAQLLDFIDAHDHA